MKKHFLLFIVLIAFSVAAVQAQESTYSTLIVYTGPYGGKDSVKVGISNQPAFGMTGNQVARYKVFSEGGTTIRASIPRGYNFKDSWYLPMEHGKTYHVWVSFYEHDDIMKLVKESVARGRFRGTEDTIFLEENVLFNTAPYAHGTGFLVSTDGYVITNSHVVENSKKIFIRGINGDRSQRYEAKLVNNDQANDLALLKVTDTSLKFDSVPFRIRNSAIETGEEVVVLGYPLKNIMGDEIKLTSGVLSSKSGYKGNFSTFQVSAPVLAGNSGSPLFDKSGNLIGVINARLRGTDAVNYAIKIAYLDVLLKSSELTTEQLSPAMTSPMPLVDLARRYTPSIYIIETER